MMKGNFKRLLALLLMLCILVSVFAVFATATDEEVDAGEEEEEESVTMILNRSFDEGWDLSNGFSVATAGVPGANFFVDNETGLDYKKNYFARIEFGDRTQVNKDSYMSIAASDLSSYIVMQFNLKVDDAFHYSNRVCYSQIKSSTGQNQILTLSSSSIGAFGQTICDTSYDWVTLTYVFDFTGDAKAVTNGTTSEYGTCKVVATDEAGNVIGSAEANQVWPLNTMRFGSHNANGNVAGESFCLDDFRLYVSSTGRVLSAEEANEYGYGSQVNANAALTVPIDKGDGENTGAASDPFETSIAFKVGVEYFLKGNAERMPIFEAENGDVYGAPVVHNGNIYVPVEPLLDMLGYEYYVHSDGLAYDVSSGLSATSIYAGRTSAVADGKEVYLVAAPEYITEKVGNDSYTYLGVCIQDIETLFPGVYMDYSNMGLIFISRADNLIDVESDISTLVTMMKKFIYPDVNSEIVRDSVAARTEAVNGTAQQHPYIYANQDDFDRLAANYAAKEGDENYDAYVTKGIQAYIKAANKILATWATALEAGDEGYDEAYKNYLSNGIGVYENGTIYLPYISVKPGNTCDPNHVGRRAANGKIITEEQGAAALNNGYDTAGGRLTGSMDISEDVQNLAFVYQVTGNITYAMVGYELLTGIAEWDHWGPGHFLNCADTAQYYAVAYDWLYNAFGELETSDDPAIVECRERNEYKYSRDVVADGLFWNGIQAAYSTAIEKRLPDNRNHPDLGTGQIIAGTTHGSTGWYAATQNWNCVCNCGILLSCLALLDETDVDRVEKIDKLIDTCFNGLIRAGLDCYAPDGSYPEGAGYWQYGTLQFFKTVAAFNSSCGTDFNLLAAPGIDKTCYYATHVCSSDSIRFGYHDDAGAGNLDSTWFIMVGEGLKDEGVIQLRMNKIRQGTAPAYGDLFYWNKDYLDSTYELPRSYFMEGMDTVVIRDAWEKGSLFTGLHGGPNLVNHGNIDAGTFIYLNNGTYWFCELGSENYNVGSYFSTSTRYTYYRCNTEGQNTICITGDQANVKYGQRSDSTAKTVAYGENEHGAYHILDMTDCYWRGTTAKTGVNYGYRGIFVTNDFKTTVIRDDIEFKGFNSLYWFAHTTQNIEIAENGKVAYLTNSKGDCVRVTIVAEGSGFRFVEMDAYTTVLDVTVRMEENNKQYSRDDYKKLAIVVENVLDFRASVVIERIGKREADVPLGYTMENYHVGMYDKENGVALWTPYGEKKEIDNSVGAESDLIITPTTPSGIRLEEKLLTDNVLFISLLGDRRFGSEIERFYNKLTEIAYVSAFLPSVTVAPQYIDYQMYCEEYGEFIKGANEEAVAISKFAKAMLGF